MRAYGLLFFLILFPLTAWAQSPEADMGDSDGGLRLKEMTTWVVFGHVTDMRGNPLGNVRVRIDIGVGTGSTRSLKTNLQGEFQMQFVLDANQHKTLSVMAVANKPGYLEAHETKEFGSKDVTGGINFILRETTPDPDELPLAKLVSVLGPPLREAAIKSIGTEAVRRDVDHGSEELLVHQQPMKALSSLTKAVDRAPKCVECRLLLTLAKFETGGWSGAAAQLEEANKLNDAAAAKRPEPPLLAGVLEAWRGDAGGAVDSFQKALAIDPRNALALQEFGRVLISLKKWEAADQNLEKALQAGAGDEARLLRIRALLAEGDIAEAGHEMDQYTAGHDLKSLPPETRTLYLQVQERLKLEPYAKVKSVLTQSPPDLVKAMPELAGMTSDQAELAGILKKVGEGVEAYFKNFPNTVSIEHVHQERLGSDNKALRSLDNDFQYLLLAHPSPWGMDIQEQRANLRGGISALGGLDDGFMLTGGFASISLLFHPGMQEGADFRYLGRLTPQQQENDKTQNHSNEKSLYVVAFAQKPEKTRITERFKTESGSAVILVQGVAWIDPTSFQIVRLRTDLLAPQPKVKLLKQTTEVQYKRVAFKEVTTELWLPQEVSVTVALRGRVYHNLHRYSDFKLFNVSTNEERKSAALPAESREEK